MVNPRNAPEQPEVVVEQMLSHLHYYLEEEASVDFEAVLFTVARIQRVALEAIAHPERRTARAEVAPGVESDSLRAMQQTDLAARALKAVQEVEDRLKPRPPAPRAPLVIPKEKDFH